MPEFTLLSRLLETLSDFNQSEKNPQSDKNATQSVRPKILGYSGCKRTGFVKPGSMKLAMGHLLHGEAAP